MEKINWQSRPELFTGTVTPMQRMTPGLLDFYSYSDVVVIRAESPSAVTMQFKSNTTRLQIAMQFGGAAREIFTTDVFVNNRLTTLNGDGVHDLELGSGEKDIAIHFPHLVVIKNLEISIDANASLLPRKPAAKLVLCGDSILQGMTCSTPSKALGVLTAGELGMELHNTAVGGAIMQPIPVEEALKLNGAITIVGFGINDAAHETPIDLFRERVRQILTLLSQAAGKTFILTPIPALVPAEANRELYSNIIREEHRNFPAVNLIEGAGLLTADNDYFVDGLHPNDSGMKIYAGNLTNAIRQAL
ncbi:MAG: hypothetical protein E7047_07590 [Lentisphaerae bacterium]|nr:hypothetical protein [Lentisphaerota bacterium]